MLWAQALHVPVAVFAVLGLLVIVGRLRAGRRSAAQWLALIGFGAWSAAAALNAGWPLLEAAGVDVDVRRLAVNLLNVICVLAVSLVVTTFGVRERLRPVFVVAAVAAACVVWWLPGHGVIVERRPQAAWQTWIGMSLYLGYLAATVGCLLELGRAHNRAQLPLAKHVQVRLLQALAAAALTYVGAKALLFIGVQAEWPGFFVESSSRILQILLAGVAALFWLALAPPDAWLRLAARMEATEARAFAATFALQTKEDAARGRDLGWRVALIALAEQVARAQGCGFDEVANLRLAAALLYTDFDVRASSEPMRSMRHGRLGGDESASRLGVHSVVARTVWVPAEVLDVLREAASDTPKFRAARVLKVVDSFVATANPWDPGVAAASDAASAFAEVDREFANWEEVAALRRALSENGAL